MSNQLKYDIKDKPKKFYITYNYLDGIVKDFINS